MSQTKLTSRSLAGLPLPSSGRLEYPDDKVSGLALRVSSSGHKSWVLYYRHHGRLRRLTLGTLDAIGLADARDAARRARATVVQGADPAAEKRGHRDALTFGALTGEYLERHAKPKKRSWRADEAMLRRHVPKDWTFRKAADITRRDVRAVLDSIVADGTPIAANRVFALLRKVFNFAVSRELVPFSPCVGIERPSVERQRDRVLSNDELRQVWEAFDSETLPTATLFKLYLLTAQRGAELRSMAWADVDLDAGWWVIPAATAKNGLAHRVPLSPAVTALLRILRDSAPGSSHAFASPSRHGYRQVMHKATARVRKQSGVDFWPHDLRRTAASYMTGMGVSRLVVSKLLNHVERGVTAVYDRHSYDPEKQGALNMWAIRLDGIVHAQPTSNVLPMRA